MDCFRRIFFKREKKGIFVILDFLGSEIFGGVKFFEDGKIWNFWEEKVIFLDRIFWMGKFFYGIFGGVKKFLGDFWGRNFFIGDF